MRVMMIGDVVGEPGLRVLESRLPALIAEYAADFAVVNGENAAEGFGLTAEALDRILAAGADVVTSGNHIWEKRDFWQVLDGDKPVLRPANYPSVPGTILGEAAQQVPGTILRAPVPNTAIETTENTVPGKGWICLEKNGLSVLVINLQGREQMTPIDCPFRCFDSITAESESKSEQYKIPYKIPSVSRPSCVIVDFHAESTEEKEALGYYLNGRASVVAGTHTHIQTADDRILPKGTAYITDLGMTGAANGVLGMNKDICLNRAYSQIAFHMECSQAVPEKDCAIQGIIAELDANGRAVSIARISR